jgi:nicotinate-nucleotide--dimethylbenzimidazole phosphoribosyltransferase
MTPIDAIASIQTGVALVYSLADDALDVLALGQISPGGETVSAAVIAALTAMDPDDLGPEDASAVRSAMEHNLPDVSSPLDVLAKLGGPEIGMMAGAILGAASISVPVVLDDHATSAAALIATELAPDCAGYLIASHNGRGATHRRALAHIGLSPLFDLGLAHGEGTGAALALPMVEAAARMLREIPS